MENKKILLVSAFDGVEIDWVKDMLVEKWTYYYQPIATTKSMIKDDEQDKFLFLTKDTFHRKQENMFNGWDFFFVRNVDWDYEWILKNSDNGKPRIIIVDEEQAEFLKYKLTKLWYDTSSYLFTLDAKYQVDKLGNERRYAYRKVKRVVGRDNRINQEIYDFVLEWKFEWAILDYFIDLLNN